MLRVLIADDHEIVRRGLIDLLSTTSDITVVGEAATTAQALARIPALRPRVAVLDARLPDGSVTVVHVDSQIIEQSVITGQLDGQVAVASSSVPKYVTQNVGMRFFPFADQGLKLSDWNGYSARREASKARRAAGGSSSRRGSRSRSFPQWR